MARRVLASIVVLIAAAAAFAQESTDKPPATSQPSAPVDYRKLKEAMPATLIDLPRVSLEGSHATVGDATTSTAKARYEDNKAKPPRWIDVTLTAHADPDGFKTIGGMIAAKIDREGDDGYTKTTEIQGRRALIIYDASEKMGTLSTIAGGKIVVRLESYVMSDADFRKAVDAFPLKALDALATAP